MFKKPLLIILVLLSTVSTVALAKDYVKATDIQKVNIGDTFDEVTKKIGEPQQILSKELTSDGKDKTVWLYEAIPQPRLKTKMDMFDMEGTETPLNLEKQYQVRRLVNPPYLIEFIDGKVSSIKRQQ